MPRTGLMLVNLGTPDSTEVVDVRRYLRQFLSDPRVLDINPAGRWLLLNAVILPTRPKESAKAYQSIWTNEGSPLLHAGLELEKRLQRELGDAIRVRLGMRYQNPSIESAWRELEREDVERLIVFPLFPQYSSAAWGSAIEEVYRVISTGWNVPSVQVIPPYYDHPAFIRALTEVAKPRLEAFRPEATLLSFHGVPERHCTKSDRLGNHCLVRPDCCDRIEAVNRYCYRAQCMATSRALVSSLDLRIPWEVTFQSRLGRDPWIKPYTDVRIRELANEGVKRLAVFSPSFTADCLETLEEIAIRGREDFQTHGGEELELIPSLNDEDVWVEAIQEILGSAQGEFDLTIPAG